MKLFKVIKNIFKLIKISIKCPEKYEVVNEAINGEWFDYCYLYDLELVKLTEMRDKFEKQGISADNDKYVSQMSLAIKLLEIIIEEGGFHFERNPEFNEEDGISKFYKYVCDVNVNTNNALRFVPNKDLIDYYTKSYPHELYLLKARYLYHKLRYEFEQTWWD